MKVRSCRLTLRLALCAALVAGALAGSAAPVSAACETIYVEAYTVDLEVGRKTYRVGETARVDATVTRTDTGTPVEGARIYAALFYEDSIVYDLAETDAAGGAVMHLKLRRNDVEPGSQTIHSMAQETVADAACAAVVEYGRTTKRDAFTIKP